MAKQPKQKVDIKYKLKAIELLEGKLNFEPSAPNNDNIFNFDIKIENKFDAQRNLVITINEVNISEKEVECGSIKVSCIFEIENFEAFEQDSNTGQFKIPKDLLTTINSVSISTTRGVMFGYFRGTQLHHAYLPIIIPAQMKEDIEKK